MKFSEVTVGQKFKFKEVIFTKSEPQKVSCCKTLNAAKVDDNQKVMFRPNDEVEIVPE